MTALAYRADCHGDGRTPCGWTATDPGADLAARKHTDRDQARHLDARPTGAQAMSLTDPRLRIPIRYDEQPWNDRALCAETYSEAFFPLPGEATAPAKAVCAKCPVATECLTYALEHDEKFGIWGGLTAYDRKQMKRARP